MPSVLAGAYGKREEDFATSFVRSASFVQKPKDWVISSEFEYRIAFALVASKKFSGRFYCCSCVSVRKMEPKSLYFELASDRLRGPLCATCLKNSVTRLDAQLFIVGTDAATCDAVDRLMAETKKRSLAPIPLHRII